jgi:teichuronic acid biosynthesis glycosyltransferase TuaG
MKNPEVSVIMPNYNGANYLIASISSLLRQTFTDWELVLIDDCSTDRSWNIIQSYATRIPKIKCIKNAKRVGPGAARNKGLELATGRFIAFLDSDDLWPSDRLTHQITFMKDNKIVMSFGDYDRIDPLGHKILKEVHEQKESVEFDDLLGNPLLSITTLMIDRTKIETLPKFPENIWRAEDYLFHLELLRLAHKAIRIPRLLAHYRTGLASNSQHGCMKEMWWIYSKKLHLGPATSAWYFALYIFNAFERRFRNYNWTLKPDQNFVLN